MAPYSFYLVVNVIETNYSLKDECQDHALRARIIVFIRTHAGRLRQIAIKMFCLVYLHQRRHLGNAPFCPLPVQVVQVESCLFHLFIYLFKNEYLFHLE